MATTHQHDLDPDVVDEDDGIDDSEFILPIEKGRVLFDEAARFWMGMSGEEFLRRWDAGDYRNLPDTPEGWRIVYVRELITLARRDP